MDATDSTTSFYVYLHRRAIDGRVFYVGKGAGRRAWATNGRSRYWRNIATRHGFTVEIAQAGMQEWWAFELECALIALYGRDTLCNLTDGGEGASGFVRSAESSLKAAEKNRGRKHTAETIERMRAAQGNRSQKTRMKLSKAKTGIPRPQSVIDAIVKAHSKPVVCTDNGMHFSCCVDAAKWLHSQGYSKAQGRPISDCAKGKYLKAYGHKWKYA
jgi:hypothetical protein